MVIEKTNTGRIDILIRVDKLQITCNRVADPNLIDIPGFSTKKADTRASKQTSIPTVARVRTLKNTASGTKALHPTCPSVLATPNEDDTE